MVRPLIIEAANLTNTGTLEATNGAGLQFNYANVTNTSHTITATGTNSYVQLYSMTLTGGTLTTSSGATAYAEHNSTLTGITNTGTLTIPDNNNVSFTGTVTNTGTITVDSTGDATTLVIPAGQTLTLAGSGTLTLSNNAQNTIASSSCSNATLVNQSTIQGSGTMFGNTNCYGTLTNSGTIIANQSVPLLPIAVIFTNTGTLSVAAGSTMSFQGSLSNFKPLVNGTLSGGAYQVTGTLQIPGDITSNAATITLTGTAAQIIDLSGTNSLAGFTTNSGTLNLAPSLLSVMGSFTESGTLGVSVGGTAAGSQYGKLTAAGAVTVGGTLNITLTNGYIPPIGTSFVILTGSSISGVFAKVNGTAINSSEHFKVLYSSTAVTLSVLSGTGSTPPLAGSGSECPYRCPRTSECPAADPGLVPLLHTSDTPREPRMAPMEGSRHPLSQASADKPRLCLGVDCSIPTSGLASLGESRPESHPAARCSLRCHGSISPPGHGRGACVFFAQPLGHWW